MAAVDTVSAEELFCIDRVATLSPEGFLALKRAVEDRNTKEQHGFTTEEVRHLRAAKLVYAVKSLRERTPGLSLASAVEMCKKSPYFA